MVKGKRRKKSRVSHLSPLSIKMFHIDFKINNMTKKLFKNFS